MRNKAFDGLFGRDVIAAAIAGKLTASKEALAEQFQNSGRIRFFYLDDVLPDDLAADIYNAFPPVKDLKIKKSLREFKFISAQMNKHQPLLEESLYAFQDKRVVGLVSEIVKKNDMTPDEHLYAGGVSMMVKDHYLNPHLDNSHDKDRRLWRNLNLLYYVAPNWELDFGGNLELWPNGTKLTPTVIHSKFNRLVVMETHHNSWHSVSPVRVEAKRCCVSNYYFGETPIDPKQQFHVTSFRARPEQPLRDFALQFDAGARMILRKFFPKGLLENKHKYYK